MLYGILMAWLVVGGLAVFAVTKMSSVPVVTVSAAVSGVLLLAVIPAMRRGAWVYTNARKYHTAEYMYELGNGAEVSEAVGNYEKKVQKAVGAWLKRKLLKNSFGVLPVTFLVFVLAGYSWFAALTASVMLALMTLLAVFTAMWTMLLSARRLCYDRFGNIKNN